MRKFVFLFLLFMVFAVQAQEDLYESGNYEAAIAMYEARIAIGEEGGAIYYNLANAYFESGQLALALLNYRRAERFLPRDDDIAFQIARLRGERQDTIGAELDWLHITANLTADMLTIHELAWIVFAIWSLLFLLLAFKRKSLRWLFWTSAVALLIGSVLLSTRLYIENQRPEAILMSDAVQVMSGPAEDYLPLYILYGGAELRIIEERGDWARFVLADGRSGWLEIRNVSFITN